MSGITNRGKNREQDVMYRGGTSPATFYAALVLAANIGTLDNAAAGDQGNNIVRIPITGHGMSAGNSLSIQGSTNYDGNFVITNVPDVDHVDIRATFNAETFAGTEVCYEGPGPDTNTLSDLSEIPAGNGYTSGGQAVERSVVGFPTLTEDDANDQSTLVMKNLTFTASGGNLPASGNGAAFLVLTDDNATVGSRDVLAWWDLGGQRTVSNGQDLGINSATMNLAEPAC